MSVTSEKLKRFALAMIRNQMQGLRENSGGAFGRESAENAELDVDQLVSYINDYAHELWHRPGMYDMADIIHPRFLTKAALTRAVEAALAEIPDEIAKHEELRRRLMAPRNQGEMEKQLADQWIKKGKKDALLVLLDHLEMRGLVGEAKLIKQCELEFQRADFVLCGGDRWSGKYDTFVDLWRMQTERMRLAAVGAAIDTLIGEDRMRWLVQRYVAATIKVLGSPKLKNVTRVSMVYDFCDEAVSRQIMLRVAASFARTLHGAWYVEAGYLTEVSVVGFRRGESTGEVWVVSGSQSGITPWSRPLEPMPQPLL